MFYILALYLATIKTLKHIKFNFFILICNMLLQNEGDGGQGSFAVATEIYPKIETALGPSFVCQFKWIHTLYDKLF